MTESATQPGGNTAIRWQGNLTCALDVSDLDKSIAWYTQVLGFKLRYRVNEYAWCEMETPVPGVTVGLGQNEKVATAGGPTLVFGTHDIDATRAVLEGQKVRFDGATRTLPGMVKLATFFDLDGHKFMLSQSLEGA
jgi:catechol 2,3-dioxygenase-like lactoylglutathione lyase family enzyme